MTQVLLLLIVLLVQSGCYVIDQALHQNKLMNSRVPVEEVIENPETAQRVAEKLEFTRRIIRFASQHGLNTAYAYDYYVEIEGEAISYTFYAAESLSLRSHTWWFPIVGEVPYLGFFSKEERDEEADVYLRDGFDIHRSRVGAFSSLGWFEDPIYSTMLERSDTSLAHLLFHELVHRTYWAPGSVQFNENLAEYGAIKLTEMFVKEGFIGENAKDELNKYNARRDDKKTYRGWLRGMRRDLDQLYKSDISAQDKLHKKSEIFQTYLTSKFPSFKTALFQSLRESKWNNARILAASLYNPDLSRFDRAYQCLGEPGIGAFLNALEQAERHVEDLFAALDSLCPREVGS